MLVEHQDYSAASEAFCHEQYVLHGLMIELHRALGCILYVVVPNLLACEPSPQIMALM